MLNKFWDSLFFFSSAAVISGILVSFIQLEQYNFISVMGWVVALLWMLISRGWRGAAMAYKEMFDLGMKEVEDELNSLENH